MNLEHIREFIIEVSKVRKPSGMHDVNGVEMCSGDIILFYADINNPEHVLYSTTSGPDQLIPTVDLVFYDKEGDEFFALDCLMQAGAFLSHVDGRCTIVGRGDTAPEMILDMHPMSNIMKAFEMLKKMATKPTEH